MNKYIVSIWAGVGYCMKQVSVEAFHDEEALEAAMSFCQKNGLHGLYLEEDELDEDLSEAEREELYIYIDPTLYDSQCHPAYFLAENLGIQKVA